MTTKKQVWFGMKLTPEEKQKIKSLAEQKGTSAKEAVMRLVDDALSQERVDVQPGSFLDGIEELVGSVEGPPDLSTNPMHMQGFGR
ncbi:MAG TPA: hypothetical protein VFG50_08655 [Rhodothermales bacterium]|nr:hypothetical protein [Rhodothermales bacterium]